MSTLYRVDEVSRSVVRVTPEHGTRARYLHRTLACRCVRCTRANTRYMASYRARPAREWTPRRYEQLTFDGVA